MQSTPAYDELVGAALRTRHGVEEFAWLDGRADGWEPSWSYPAGPHRTGYELDAGLLDRTIRG